MKRAALSFGVSAFLTAFLDLASKAWVESTLAPFARLVLVDGFLVITNVRNPGAAFGLFSSGGWGRIAFFSAVTLIAMGFILWMVKRMADEKRLEPALLGLIFGGAAGNMVDRVRYGEVVDFIDVFWRSYHWYTFNVADAGICVGVFGILLLEFMEKKPPETT